MLNPYDVSRSPRRVSPWNSAVVWPCSAAAWAWSAFVAGALGAVAVAASALAVSARDAVLVWAYVSPLLISVTCRPMYLFA